MGIIADILDFKFTVTEVGHHTSNSYISNYCNLQSKYYIEILAHAKELLILVHSQVKGAWSGLVSHLNQEKATIGWAHFFVTADWAKLIDFTTPWDTDRLCLFVSVIIKLCLKIRKIILKNFSPKSLTGTRIG